MNNLPPNPSVEELQHEIGFTYMLLETLDPDSETYCATKFDYEGQIANMQARVDALQGNIPGPSHSTDQFVPAAAPLQPNVANAQHNEPSSFFAPGTRKRPRTLEDTLATDHANKSSRTTPSPAATTPGTSSSNDSFPELFEGWPPQAQAGGVRQAHSSLNHALEPPRQSEARAARARAAEQARQEADSSQAWGMQNRAMQQMQRQPPPQSPGLSSMIRPPSLHLAPGSQNANGSFQVPLRAPSQSHQSPPVQRSMSSQSLRTGSPRHTPQRLPSMNNQAIPRSMSSQSIKSENSGQNRLRVPAVSRLGAQRTPMGSPARPPFHGSSSRPQQTNNQGVEIIDLSGDTDSDSDCQETTPWGNRNRTQQAGNPNGITPGYNQQGNGYASSSQNWRSPVPNTLQLPSSGNARTSAGRSIYNTLVNSQNSPIPIDDFDDILDVLDVDGSWSRDGFRRGGSASNLYHGGSQRSNFFGYSAGDDGMGYMPGAYPTFADPGDVFNREQDWRERYGGYGAHDSKAVEEELRKMLGNIRPDDEIPPELRLSTPEALAVTLMEHQKLGVSWMKKMEEGSNHGSILADEMGLGKTVQALSLIVSRPSEDPRRKTTLVIAPVALMRQWEREIKTKVKGGRHALSVITYHGSSKKRSFKELSKYDVVLTSFGTVASEFSRKEKIRVFEAPDPDATSDAPARPKNEDYILLGKDSLWYRIILDEAHNIRNRDTKTSKACCELQSIYRLCMTGTPMMNRTDELFGLIRFLRIQPYCEWSNFRRDIKASLEKGTAGIRDDAMRKLQALLKAVLLRRTQESKIDGKVIFELPPKTIVQDHVAFDEEQQAFYNALENKTRLKFNKYLKAGTVGKQYSHILVLLLRLRQACCHPHLLKDFAEPAGDIPEDDLLNFARQLSDDVVARIKAEEGAFSCPICLDGVENPAIFLPCGHNACSECFARITSEPTRPEEGYKCPNCRGKLDPKKITDYMSFKKVYMPNAPAGDEDGFLQQEEATASSDSEDEDDDDDDEDDDLDGFIVPDDAVDGSDFTRPRPKPKPSKGKARKEPKQKKTLAQLRRDAHKNKDSKKRYFKRLCKDWVTSAKVDRTIELLRTIREGDPTEKTLVFSQFTSLLDIIEVPLARETVDYTRLDGSMTPDMRNDAVNKFIDSPSCNVMLVSLKAGNAGLNLNAASQVIILDPFWNPYVEYQAIGRAHRLGQTRPVMINRILVPKTVEDRIMDLQRKKEELITMALDENAGRNIARLGVQELSYLFVSCPSHHLIALAFCSHDLTCYQGVRQTLPNQSGE